MRIAKVHDNACVGRQLFVQLHLIALIVGERIAQELGISHNLTVKACSTMTALADLG